MRASTQAGLFAAVIILTSGLGFLREIIVARTFGTSMEMDCFIVAFAIVSFIGAVLSPQTMQTMFMPAYQDEMLRSPTHASEIANNVAISLLLLLLAGTLAGYILAPYIVKVLMPGFNNQQIHLTKELIRTMIPLVTLYGIASLGHAICNSHKKFVLPLSSQTMNNVTLLGLLLFAPINSVETLAWYHLIGGVVSVVLLLYAYMALVPSLKPNFKNRAHILALHATWPLLFLALVDQAATLLPRSLGSLLEHGDITALNYAYRFITLPVAIIATAIASVLFPTIINHVREEKGHLSGAIHMGTSMLIFCLAPISVFMCLESRAIVELFFSSNNFGNEAVVKTASCLGYYALGIVGFGYLMFLNRIYCAYRLYWAYTTINLIAFIALVGIALWLSPRVGHDGVAIAFAAYSYIACAMLIFHIRRLAGLKLLSTHSILRVICSLAIAAVLLVKWQADSIVLLCLEATAFMIFYGSLLWISKDKELLAIIEYIRTRNA